MSLFGQKLKELRTEQGLTQTQLADAIGLSFSAISMYERGERIPDFETIEKFADYFNVDFNYILGKSSVTTHLHQNLVLSEQEQSLVKAYRNADSQIKSKVERLLNSSVAGNVVPVAAYGGGVSTATVTASDDDINLAIQEDNENTFVIKAKDTTV